MLNKIRKNLKDKAGFTLVELIVVLVILAILAAMLVPALTGYIDKANKQKITATTRQVVMAAQTHLSEKYASAPAGSLSGSPISVSTEAATGDMKDIGNLAEILDNNNKLKNGIASVKIDYDSKGVVTEVTVVQIGKTCVYNGTTGTYTDRTTDANASRDE